MIYKKLRVVAFVCLGGLVTSTLFAQELTDASFAKWKDYILSKPEELTWKVAIAWEQNLGQGILKSIKSDKPMLLWVEAGDPQGCV
jgi:hypothetical protein